MQRTLLIRPETPCARRSDIDEAGLSFSSLEDHGATMPEASEFAGDGERELVDMDDDRRCAEHLLSRSQRTSEVATTSERKAGGRRRERGRGRHRGRRSDDSNDEARDASDEEDEVKVQKAEALKRFKTKNLDECPICLEPFEPDNPAVFLNCGHAFHLHCVYEWLERSSTCAVCSQHVEAYGIFEAAAAMETGGGRPRQATKTNTHTHTRKKKQFFSVLDLLNTTNDAEARGSVLGNDMPVISLTSPPPS